MKHLPPACPCRGERGGNANTSRISAGSLPGKGGGSRERGNLLPDLLAIRWSVWLGCREGFPFTFGVELREMVGQLRGRTSILHGYLRCAGGCRVRKGDDRILSQLWSPLLNSCGTLELQIFLPPSKQLCSRFQVSPAIVRDLPKSLLLEQPAEVEPRNSV